jgi:hypothetical protein
VKQETIGAILLLLTLLVTGLVGPIPLSLAIVATYGLALKLVRRRNVNQKIATALAYLSVGVIGLPMLGLLVFLCGIPVGLSFGWSLVTWSAILASGTACAEVVTPLLRAIAVDWWNKSTRVFQHS